MKTYVRKKNFHCTPNLLLGPYISLWPEPHFFSKNYDTFFRPNKHDSTFFVCFYRLQVNKTRHMIIDAIQSDFSYCEGLPIFGLNHIKTDTVQNASIQAHSCLECWLVLISLALLEYFNKVLSRLANILGAFGDYIL